MDRFMVHLKNSNYSPKDAEIILSNSRDLSYGMNLTIRDCRVSSKFIELDVSVPENNLELLLEKLLPVGKVDHSSILLKNKLKKTSQSKMGFFILIMKDFGKAMRL